MKELLLTIATCIAIIFIILFSYQAGQEREHERKEQLKQSELQLRLNGGDLVSIFK